MHQHCQSSGRRLHIINLDPAADVFTYPVSADIRDLISVTEVSEEFSLGPNGALLYCMEYLQENLDGWLFTALEGYDDADCVVFDCPGQIELYSIRCMIGAGASSPYTCLTRSSLQMPRSSLLVVCSASLQ